AGRRGGGREDIQPLSRMGAVGEVEAGQEHRARLGALAREAVEHLQRVRYLGAVVVFPVQRLAVVMEEDGRGHREALPYFQGTAPPQRSRKVVSDVGRRLLGPKDPCGYPSGTQNWKSRPWECSAACSQSGRASCRERV